MDDKRTGKVTPRASETPTDKVRADLPGRIVAWAKQHPSVLVALLAGAGASGGELTTRLNDLLALNLPSWAVLVLVAAWVGFRVIRDHLSAQEKLVANVEKLRDEMREVNTALATGSVRFDDHELRIGTIEDTFKAEIAAYVEKTRRETGKIEAESK